jgi:hypothetical protein
MILIFLFPNIAAAFGLRFVPRSAKVGRLICYYVILTSKSMVEHMLISVLVNGILQCFVRDASLLDGR